MPLRSATILAAVLALPLNALAEPDKSAYNLFNPTPAHLLRDLSTDRPDTTESPYTVDAGHLQVELSFLDYTYDRRNPDDTTAHTLTVSPVLLKVGLLNNVDLQLGLDPYTWAKSTDRTTDDSNTLHGFGDTTLRLKINLLGNDSGPLAVALMPFLKLPTATGNLGNDHLEGGLIAPLTIALPQDFTLGLMLELDVLRNAANTRYVYDLVHTITLSRPLLGELAGFIEYAGFANLNHDEKYRAYFNTGLTYGLTPNIQLDCGLRAGLTQVSDDLGLFAGVSFRH